jgi:hypothetical protein
MRGRTPRPLAIAPADYLVLKWLALDGGAPNYQARRARILLAAAAGERIAPLAARLGCHCTTVWRLCRRYEPAGLSGVLANGRRQRRQLAVGRPRRPGREAS